MKRVSVAQIAEVVTAYPALEGLPRTELSEDLEHDGVSISAPADTRLFEEGAVCRGFPMVLEGEVQVARRSRSGRSMELYRVSAGGVCVVSATGLLGQCAMIAHGTTTQATRLLLLPPDLFEKWTGHLPFRRFIFGTFAERMTDLMTIVESVAFQRLDQRLADYLLGRGRYVRLTHQAVADELGTVRESVSRLLERFHGEGLVALSRECIEIVDPVRLRGIAGGGNEAP
jgi:CRP/FNR family transcriptional regulator